VGREPGADHFRGNGRCRRGDVSQRRGPVEGVPALWEARRCRAAASLDHPVPLSVRLHVACVELNRLDWAMVEASTKPLGTNPWLIRLAALLLVLHPAPCSPYADDLDTGRERSQPALLWSSIPRIQTTGPRSCKLSVSVTAETSHCRLSSTSTKWQAKATGACGAACHQLFDSYWDRQLVEVFMPPLSLDSPLLPKFMSAFGWSVPTATAPPTLPGTR